MNSNSVPATRFHVLLIGIEEPHSNALVDTLTHHSPQLFDVLLLDRLDLALQAIKEQEPDAILLDAQFPQGTFPDNLRACLSIAGLIPIIVIANAANPELALHALEAGAQDFLVKTDINANALARIIRYAISRARLDQRLLKNEIQMRQLLEHSPVAVAIRCARDNSRMFVNQCYLDLFHTSYQHALRNCALEKYQNQLDYQRIGERIGRGEIIVNYEMGLQTETQQEIWVLASYFPMEYENEAAVLSWFYDISAIHQAHEALALADRTKAQFLSTMSHEIRTPMNAIIGMAELLADTRLNQQQLGYTEIIKNSTTSLLNIINDILDFEEIESGQIRIQTSVCQLPTLFDQVVQRHQPHASAKHLTLSSQIDPGLPALITSDPRRLQQIVNHLLTNAIKFSEHGAIVLRVLQVQRPGQMMLRLEVSDQGIGIAPQHISTLFQPFTQADGSNSRSFGGTGLGLSICQRLVQLMGGSIGVESQPGLGSTFWLELPLLPADASAIPPALASDVAETSRQPEAEAVPAQTPAPARHAASSPGLPRVLVVDDNHINQTLVLTLLGKLGYQADQAFDGHQALAAHARCDYSLILMDCQMPHMDGFEATRKIRAIEGEQGRHTAIIAVTANAMPGDRERCLQAGMDDYLAKPFYPDAFFAMVKRWIALDAEARIVAAPTEAIIDFTLLNDICGGDTHTIQQFLEMFVASTRPLLQRLQQAVEQSDFATIRSVNHELAGTAANLGMQQIHALVEPLRKTYNPPDVVGAARVHQQMVEAFGRVCQSVQTRRAGLDENVAATSSANA